MRNAAFVLLIAIAAGCAKPRAEQTTQRGAQSRLRPVAEKPPDDTADRETIMSLAHGATVVSRTGELLLENSAVRAIDGDPISGWMPPPNDLPQTITLALPARTRIERVGVRSDGASPVNRLQFERSLDGTRYEPLATVTAKATTELQWFDIPAGEASHLRITAIDSLPGRQVLLQSLLLRGSELEAPRAGDVAGCWSMNGVAATFDRRDDRVTGNVTFAGQPMQLDGGFDGRVYRFNWIRGNDYGYALLTVAPDGRTFSGMEWHEEAIPLFYGDSWFGARKTCGSAAPAGDIRDRFLRRASRYSLFGIRFRDDGTVDRERSADTLQWLAAFAANNPVQLIGWEFRRGNAAANRQFANRELASVIAELERIGVKQGSVTFVAKGSDDPRQVPGSDAARVLYSTIDVEIRR